MKPVRQPSDTAVLGKVHKRLSNIERRLGGSSGTSPVVITSQQWAVKGAVTTAIELPPIFVTALDSNDYNYDFQENGVADEGPLAVGAHRQVEEVYLIGANAYLGQATSATLQIRDAPAGGGSQLGTNISAASSFGGTRRADWTGVRVYDGDHLHLHCTAISGTPRILTVAAVFAHLYGPAS